MRLVVTLVAALLVAGCGGGVSESVSDSQFRLTTDAPRLTYRVGEAIDITATLTYVGPAPRLKVDGIYGGPVAMSFKQLDGPLSMAAVSRLMCSRKPVTLIRGIPMTFQPTKSGGWDPSAPTASFYVSWIADPLVHLPAGRWQIESILATCGVPGQADFGDHNLTTPPIILTVTP